MINKFSETGWQQIWDASSLQDYRRCPTYWWYRDSRRLRFAGGEQTLAADWGSAWHLGQEVFETSLWDKATRKEALKHAIAAVSSQYGNYFEANPDTKRNLDTLIRALVWYEKKYRHDTLNMLGLPSGRPGIEVRFEIPIPRIPERWSGRIDKLVEYNGDYYIVDRKTTAKTMSSFYFRDFSPNIQFISYCWALQSFLGTKVRGLIVDAVQTAVGFTRFGRHTYQFAPRQLSEFERNMRTSIIQARKEHKSGYMPFNESNCNAYRGCQYARICRECPEYRETWIAEDYIVAPPRIKNA
jgi:hypothetical protein